MPFVVARGDSWEIRESSNTGAGPRSRTLATFKELTEDVIEHALGRASKPLQAADLKRAAVRAGAPVAGTTADRAARELLAQLSRGNFPRPALRQVLAAALPAGSAEASDAARAAGEWAAASLEQRGEALSDLLLLADAFPHSPRGTRPLKFPRLHSAGT